jgi:hypothetical protein
MFDAFPCSSWSGSTYQREWAADVMLAMQRHRLIHGWCSIGWTTFFSPDVKRFLGCRVPPTAAQWQPASRSSHRRDAPAGECGSNSVKMYDRQGSALRAEEQ